MIRNNVLTNTAPAPAARRDETWTRRRPKNKVLWLVIGSLIVVLFLAVLVRGIGNYPFWSQAYVTAVDPPEALPGETLTMLAGCGKTELNPQPYS
jgi:hypothetical protein